MIKDSVDVKTTAFESLFRPHGADLAKRVRDHHERHGGVSRFEKMPLYLGWAGLDESSELAETYCRRFSDLVLQAVIDSPWVPGAREYLQGSSIRQYFILVSATPQGEIEEIVSRLGIAGCFREIHGAPIGKSAAVQDVMLRHSVAPGDALLIGDADADLAAATENGIAFLLRRTSLNKHLQERGDIDAFDDFRSWAGVAAPVTIR